MHSRHPLVPRTGYSDCVKKMVSKLRNIQDKVSMNSVEVTVVTFGTTEFSEISLHLPQIVVSFMKKDSKQK